MTPYRPKVGDYVRTHERFWGSRRLGYVKSINGAYIMVELNYRNVMLERYPNELELIKRPV